MKPLIVFLLFPFFTYSQQMNDADRSPRDSLYAVKAITNALLNPSKTVCFDTLIPNKETAIELAELILFKVYGKDEIISERPYNVYQARGYWYIDGTLKTQFGGTFEIIFNSKDGQIIRLCHGK